MNTQPVSYLQTDPRWKNIPYAVKGERATIGGSGCGPTSMAMVLATWADPKVTPATECAWALKNGYKAKGQGTYYSYFQPAAKRYGLTCRQLNAVNIYGNNGAVYHAQAREALERGDLVIACMGRGNWTRSGHFVLVWKIEGDTVYINDPASTLARRTRGDYQTFIKEVKYYFVVQRPAAPEKEEETDVTEKQVSDIVWQIVDSVKKEIISELKPRVYNTVDELPYGQDTVNRLMETGILRGKGGGLGLTEDLLRMLIIQERMNGHVD